MKKSKVFLLVVLFFITLGNTEVLAQSIVGDGSSIATGGAGGAATANGNGGAGGTSSATGGTSSSSATGGNANASGGNASVGDVSPNASNEGVAQKTEVNFPIQPPSMPNVMPGTPNKSILNSGRGMYSGYNFNPYIRQGDKKYQIQRNDNGGCPAGNFAQKEWLVRGESPLNTLKEEIVGDIPDETDFLSVKVMSGEKSWSFGFSIFGVGAQGGDSGRSVNSEGAGGGASVISGKTIVHMLVTACGKEEANNNHTSSVDEDYEDDTEW